MHNHLKPITSINTARHASQILAPLAPLAYHFPICKREREFGPLAVRFERVCDSEPGIFRLETWKGQMALVTLARMGRANQAWGSASGVAVRAV